MRISPIYNLTETVYKNNRKRIIIFAVVGIFGFFILGCDLVMKKHLGSYIYYVHKIDEEHQLSANFHSDFWVKIKPLELCNFMGEKPVHFPKTKAKLAYDTENIYVIFHVQDQYVIATSDKYQGTPWEDSCVEFFFTPSGNISDGYFNLEMNCVGHFLFQYNNPDSGRTVIDISDCEKIEVVSSLKGATILPEITEPITWTIEYKIPFNVIEKYTKKSVGSIWKVNFYKCADNSSHPHWLTWAPVDHPTPNFHKPDFFGTLLFSDSSVRSMTPSSNCLQKSR